MQKSWTVWYHNFILKISNFHDANRGWSCTKSVPIILTLWSLHLPSHVPVLHNSENFMSLALTVPELWEFAHQIGRYDGKKIWLNFLQWVIAAFIVPTRRLVLGLAQQAGLLSCLERGDSVRTQVLTPIVFKVPDNFDLASISTKPVRQFDVVSQVWYRDA